MAVYDRDIGTRERALHTSRRLRIGVYNTEFHQRGGGEKRALVLAEHWTTHHDVVVVSHAGIDVAALARYFSVVLDDVRTVALADVRGANPDSIELAELRWTALRDLNLDVFVNASYGSTAVNPAPLGIYMCMFPVPERPDSDPYARAPQRSSDQEQTGVHAWLDSYDAITANSAFTARHIESRWSRVAVPVFTPCSPVPSGVKEKLILNVARFDPYKRQDALITAFQASDSLRREGWSLYLVGSMAGTPRDRQYVDALISQAGDDRVSVLPDVSRRDLEDLYGRAAIYWHATGFEAGLVDNPERHEHFGQTVVEAMSAGAVPVVLDAGGPAETVEHSVSGFRWSTSRELISYSEQLVLHADLRHRMSRRAIDASRAFTPAEFCRRMDAVLDGLVGGSA